MSNSKRYVAICLGLVFAAWLAEEIQPYFGRSRSGYDLINGTFGVFLGALFFRAWEIQSRRWAALGFILSAWIALLALAPAYDSWELLSWQKNRLPVLANFETEYDLRLWHNQVEPTSTITIGVNNVQAAQSSRNKNYLSVKTSAGSYVGIRYDGNSLNWSPYQTLHLNLLNSEAEPLTLNIRIDDTKNCTDFDKRFNRQVVLAPGWNSFDIPIHEIEYVPARRMHVEKIKRMLIFTDLNQPERSWGVGTIELR